MSTLVPTHTQHHYHLDVTHQMKPQEAVHHFADRRDRHKTVQSFCRGGTPALSCVLQRLAPLSSTMWSKYPKKKNDSYSCRHRLTNVRCQPRMQAQYKWVGRHNRKRKPKWVAQNFCFHQPWEKYPTKKKKKKKKKKEQTLV